MLLCSTIIYSHRQLTLIITIFYTLTIDSPHRPRNDELSWDLKKKLRFFNIISASYSNLSCWISLHARHAGKIMSRISILNLHYAQYRFPRASASSCAAAVVWRFSCSLESVLCCCIGKISPNPQASGISSSLMLLMHCSPLRGACL